MRDVDLADSPICSHDEMREALYNGREDELSIEQIEHEAYREAAEKLLPVLWGVLDFVRQGGRSTAFRLEVASYVFAHPVFRGMTLDEIGRRHGKTRAAASAAAKKLQRENHLAETLGQKSKHSCRAYSEARKAKLN
jgi:hypothetical protein